LEHQTAQLLKAAGWSVISNRYYIDDHDEKIREIDLVAYRATQVQHLRVYTSLLISCKKSDSNVWAFLARDIDRKDPNMDWWPLQAWTNDRVIEFHLQQKEAGKQYHENLAADGINEPLQFPDVEVFAFQEMKKEGGAPQDDRPIFNSITSLMKAQSYEQTALPIRRKEPAVYLFSLLSVVGADLVRLRFSEDAIRAESVDSEHYIARYIVRKRETFSRIRFVKGDQLATYLPQYSALHEKNCRWVSTQLDDFYQKCHTDSSRFAWFLDDFRKLIEWRLQCHIALTRTSQVPFEVMSLDWQPSEGLLFVRCAFDESEREFLNGDEVAKRMVANALTKVYRYDGPFRFEFVF
jgi:hypothetical protein